MQIDMTTGTGWCFGGPGLDRRTADLEASYEPKAGDLTFTTRRMVKRAAAGGKGHMLNPYSPAAMRFYLERFDQAFDRTLHGELPAMPRAQYHDSFEYSGNWSDELLGAFRQRHGYDLADHLETLFGQEERKFSNQVRLPGGTWRSTLPVYQNLGRLGPIAGNGHAESGARFAEST